MFNLKLIAQGPQISDLISPLKSLEGRVPLCVSVCVCILIGRERERSERVCVCVCEGKVGY